MIVQAARWGLPLLAVTALIAAPPPIIVCAFLMGYYIAGLTAGETKG